MTWVFPTVTSVVFVLLALWSRNQPADRLRRAVKEDPDIGRSLVRSARGTTGRVLAVFLGVGFLGTAAALLVAGDLAGLLYALLAATWLWSRAESRWLAGRVGGLLREPYAPTVQDRLRDRFSAGWAVIALSALTTAQLLGFDSEPTWQLVTSGVLLVVTFAAGVAAVWSQAWVFSERRWSRGG
ncbi:hypothetical protein KLP28_12860 [Nocardioidaceae bacterium]|nr:hypothetical protein KLP28_12860 [Nocardioidaceae bacterium]